MYSKVGFIGSGSIAGALIGGIIKKGFLCRENIYVSDIHKDKTEALVNSCGVTGVKNNISLVESVEVVVLSVKPDKYESVLNEIKDYIKKDTLLVTIAAGITMNYVSKFFDRDIKIIRAMPSTPALIGKSITAVAYGGSVEKGDIDFVKNMFLSVGIVEIVDESQIDAFTSVCSSSPAYIDMFIEAMVDAAEILGLPKNKAYMLAAHAVEGAAKMVIETKKHPGELKDMVCSPAGTAIEGVRFLEEKGIRGIVMEAVIITAEKAKLLSEKYK